MTRSFGRTNRQIRPLTLEIGAAKYAEGSCLIKFGNTHVLCTASIEEKLPPFLRNSGQGWITAEYGMLPRATHTRTDREAIRGRPSGRTCEIQRLIGRTLRSIVNLKNFGERQIKIDCDVLQADGGTRTTAITGAYIALYQASHLLLKQEKISTFPLTGQVAAISCGIVQGHTYLDLDYSEDSTAEADANFVLTESGDIVEVQVTAEQKPLSDTLFSDMLTLAKEGIVQVTRQQQETLETAGLWV